MYIGSGRKASILVSELIGNELNIAASSLIQEGGAGMSQGMKPAPFDSGTSQKLIKSLP